MIISLSEYKSLTNTTTSDDDALITLLLASSTEQIENYCNRKFEAANYLEWFVADNPCYLAYSPKQYPINKVYFVGNEECTR